MNRMIESMIKKAKDALPHAYAPYSHYGVASCLSTLENELFIGVNVENAAYGLSICAESSAICHMIADGKKTIKSLVVLNSENSFCSPCGACRQRIIEFSTPDTLIHLCHHEGIFKSLTIAELLPEAFTFKLQK